MRRLAILFLFLVVAAAAGVVTVGGVIRQELERSVDLPGKVLVEVQPGESSRRIAARLREAGLIESERVFRWAATWYRADRSIKFGRHEFEGRVSIRTILEEL